MRKVEKRAPATTSSKASARTAGAFFIVSAIGPLASILLCGSRDLAEIDIVIVTEGTDEAATAALLKVGSLGNVRTQTLRGVSVDEIKKVIGKIP